MTAKFEIVSSVFSGCVTRILAVSLCIPAFAVAMSVDSALARPDVSKMTCQQVQQTIKSNGQIVMSTGPNSYKRFVATGQYCIHGERVDTEWVNASDGSCRVRGVCKTIRPGSSR